MNINKLTIAKVKSFYLFIINKISLGFSFWSELIGSSKQLRLCLASTVDQVFIPDKLLGIIEMAKLLPSKKKTLDDCYGVVCALIC